MLEHSLGQTKAGPAANTRETDTTIDETTFIDQIRARIDGLHAQSRQGLWHMTAFLLISIAALLVRDFNILEALPEQLRVILGAPPAPYLIHIVLAVSTVSALIILGGRLAEGTGPGKNWEQLAHRSAFYFFYFFSNALDQFFLVVFTAGMVVLLLEHYHIWTFYAKAIRHEKELIKKISLWPLIASGDNR